MNLTRAQKASSALATLDRKRIDAGLCRHCGGKLPCWSPFGDVRPGVRHPMHGLWPSEEEAVNDALRDNPRGKDD